MLLQLLQIHQFPNQDEVVTEDEEIMRPKGPLLLQIIRDIILTFLGKRGILKVQNMVLESTGV